MSGTVCAVVVTYNRRTLLADCLLGLKAQTRPLDAVLVIDNASSDGTREMLASEFPDVEVLTLTENTGGAGGFSLGIRLAAERGYDWIWVMDDDVEPHTDCLERMLGYSNISGFIHVQRHYNGVPVPWEGVWDFVCLTKRTFDPDRSFAAGREWIPVNYGCFEGALIRRFVVERIGPPDERFFIAGDDSIYGFLASFHTMVIYVNLVGIEKKILRQNIRVLRMCISSFGTGS